jgi:hypothetical protein
VLNLVASVLFLGYAANVWTAQTKWQKMYEVEKAKNVEWLANVQKRQVELSRAEVYQERLVDEQKKKNVDLQLQFNKARDDALQLNVELAQIKNARDMKDAENQELAREVRRSFEDLQKSKSIILKQQQALTVERDNAVRARNEKSEMENELNVTKQNYATLQRDKQQVEQDLALQTGRVEGLIKRGVPVMEILGQEASAFEPPVNGIVLAVRQDAGLVMLSVGSDQKVKPGYQFTVSRDGQYVAKVQVEKVYPDMCSAKLVPGMLKAGMAVQVHDEATTR